MRQLLLLPAIVVLFSAAAVSQQRPMEPLDLLRLSTLEAQKISPDGRWVAYSLSLLNWEKGTRQSDLFTVRSNGENRRQMTFTEEHNETAITWARDSESILFLSDRDGGKRQIYRLPLAGGEAQKLTDEKEGVSNFELSRSGRWLAYRAGASGKRQLHRIDLAAPRPKPEPLTSHKTEVESWRWLPQPGRIVFAAAVDDEPHEQERRKKGFDVKINDPKPIAQHLFLIDPETKQETPLAQPPGVTISRLTPSRDGRLLAFRGRPAERFATSWDYEVFLLHVETKELRRVTDNKQEEDEFDFSPDGEWLAYTAPAGGEQYRAKRIFVVPTAGGDARELLAGWEYDGGLAFWAPDGGSIYFSTTIGVNAQAFRVPLAGGDAEQVTSGGHALRLDFDPDSQRLLVILSTPDQPEEIYAAPLDALGRQEQWTKLTNQAAQLEPFALGRYETIRWKSTDGREVEGLLVKPAGYQQGKRYPLVVQVHGGPAGTSMNAFPGRWSTYSHVFAGKGYAVFQPNYRGSSGYGEEFRRAIAGNYFRQGFEDIMSGVDYLIERGVADPNKLLHMGWSAGGHWSNWALTHTDRFRAIASGAGAVNWISMWAQSDMQINREFYFQGAPYENREHYIDVSPITYIKNAKTPTLILCGTADERVPNAQSRELYVNLQKLGVPVEYIEFPNMPHGLTKPRYQLVKMEAELAWFTKWLEGREDWLDWGKLLETLKEADE